MIQELVYNTAVWLFEQFNGVPIAADLTGALVHFILVAVVMGLIIVPAAHAGLSIFLPAVLVAFTVGMFLMAPSMAQRQMLTDCHELDVDVTVNVDPQTVNVQACRTKDNFYGEFGEWQIIKINYPANNG